MRTEFIKDMGRVLIQRASGRLGEKKKRRVRGSGVFIEDGVLGVHVLLGIQELLQTGTSAQLASISHLCCGARGIGESVVLENVNDNSVWSLLRCYLLR